MGKKKARLNLFLTCATKELIQTQLPYWSGVNEVFCLITQVFWFGYNLYRGQPELKEKIALCVGLIGGILGNEAGR